MYSRNEPHCWLNPITLPIVDAGFIYPDLLRDLLLKESQVKPLGSQVVAVGYEGSGICLGLRFFGR